MVKCDKYTELNKNFNNLSLVKGHQIPNRHIYRVEWIF